MIVSSADGGSLTGGELVADEDSRLSLACELELGKPASQVSWWQLQSITSMPAVRSAAPVVKEWPQLVFGSLSANVDYMTTQGAENQLVGLHSRPLTDRDLSHLVDTSGRSSSGQFKHWTRVKDQVSLSIIGAEKIQASLQLSALSRHYQGGQFLCLASNNQLAPPLNQSIQISMNRKYSYMLSSHVRKKMMHD